VDNNDPGFAITAGEWGTCHDGDCSGVSYGPDFRFAEPKCISCQARFDLMVPNAGNYDLYTWWPQGDDRATDTPFTITYSSGSAKVNVDQRSQGSGWHLLKTLALKAGGSVSVVVGGTDTGYANADAIALTPAGSGPPVALGQPPQVPPAQPTAEQPAPGQPTQAPPAQPTTKPATGKPTSFRKVIFLHHSTGANLIAQGGVRERLTALGYEFYDHGYNEDGLALADGSSAGTNFDIPDDNTNPDGFNTLFAQPVHTPPDNAFSHLLQYDVIAFKSCFPVSDIQSDEQLAEYKTYYLNIRAVMDQHRDKIFIVVTPPPLEPSSTSPEVAVRARAFANWLKSSEYLSGHPNVFTFDFFNLLADPSTNMLRANYITSPGDSHPNEQANQAIGPQFADFIDQSVKSYSK
jgi:hypothetical protein